MQEQQKSANSKFMRNYWVPIFLILLGIILLYKSTLSAEYKPTYSEWMQECHVKEFSPTLSDILTLMRRANLPRENPLPQKSEVKLWKEKKAFHEAEAMRCWAEAKEKCWYLPDQHERDLAIKCFRAAAASVATSGPCARLTAAVLVFCVEYGVDCVHEWYTIKEKLEWAEYHFLQAEHYQHLIQG